MAFCFLKFNHKSKKLPKALYVDQWRELCEYEALCEGDDYWISSKKLQLQVDFMDSHPDYGMVHTDFNLSKGKRNHKFEICSDGKYFPQILYNQASFIGTLTVMIRMSTYNSIPKLFKGKGWPMGDTPQWIEIAHCSKIGYIDVVTAKYRVLQESASHSGDINKMIAFIEAGIEIAQFYADNFDVSLSKDLYDESYYQNIVRIACRFNNEDVAKKYFIEVIVLQPKSLSLLVLCIKKTVNNTKFTIAPPYIYNLYFISFGFLSKKE